MHTIHLEETKCSSTTSMQDSEPKASEGGVRGFIRRLRPAASAPQARAPGGLSSIKEAATPGEGAGWMSMALILESGATHITPITTFSPFTRRREGAEARLVCVVSWCGVSSKHARAVLVHDPPEAGCRLPPGVAADGGHDADASAVPAALPKGAEARSLQVGHRGAGSA